MMRKYLFVMLSVSILFLGCINLPGVNSGTIDPTKLIPDKADSYAVIQVSKILQDQDFRDSVKQTSGQDIQQQLQTLTKDTGIDLTTINSMLMFFQLDQPSGTTVSYAGLILTGTFDQNLITGKIKQNSSGKFSENVYQGINVLTTTDSRGTQTSIAFLNQNTAILGSGQAVMDVIDVYKGNKQPLADTTLSLVASKINTNSMFYGIAKIPTSLKQQRGTGSQITANANAAGFSFDKNGQSVNLRAAIDFADSASASKAKDTLDGYVQIMKGSVQSGSATEKIINSVQINLDNSLISISLDTTTQDLKAFGQELKQMMPNPSSYNQNSQPSAYNQYNNPYPENSNYSYNDTYQYDTYQSGYDNYTYPEVTANNSWNQTQ